MTRWQVGLRLLFTLFCTGVSLLAFLTFWIVTPDWLSRVGWALAAVGGASNLLVIVANGGYMPFAPEDEDDTEREGWGINPYRPIDASTRLRYLSDWIHLGPRVGIISPGDLLLAAGFLAAMAGWGL